MKKWILLPALVLGLGVVGITLARQPPEDPKRQPFDRAQLRSQVVKLSVEMEILQLYHKADKDHLLSTIKDMRDFLGGSPEKDLNEDGKKIMNEFRKSIDLQKDNYAKQAAELAEKRLDMAEAEMRYNQAK